jgi:hypothetical protein
MSDSWAKIIRMLRFEGWKPIAPVLTCQEYRKGVRARKAPLQALPRLFGEFLQLDFSHLIAKRMDMPSPHNAAEK